MVEIDTSVCAGAPNDTQLASSFMMATYEKIPWKSLDNTALP